MHVLRFGRAIALASLVATLAGACGRLEDVLSPGRRADAAPARVALAARLPSLSKGRAGAVVQLRVQAFYLRADGTRVALATQIVTLDDAQTQQVPITLDLAACLTDPQRAGDAASGCVVSLDVALLEADRVLDQQTVGPIKLQAGGVATVPDPVQLVEVGEVRVGPAEAGRVRLELGTSVSLAASIVSTAGQAVSGRTVQWSSSAPDVARVDPETGAVTAASLGVARITATAPGGSGGVDVAVVPRPSVITIAPGALGSGGGVVRSSPAGLDCRVIAGQAQGTCTFTFPGDAQVTLSVTPDFSATFAGWGGACALSGAAASCVVDAAQARGATVSFSSQRRLTVDGSGVGTVTGAGGIACQIGSANAGSCEAAYADGAVVTLSATAGAQQAFAGWTGACSGLTPTCTVTLSADAAVGARFSGPLALSVSGGGEGSGTIAVGGGASCAFRPDASTPCTASFPFGTVVTLTATPDVGSTFAGWTGACSGAEPCRVTMDQARSVSATFARRLVTLSLSLGGPGAGAVLAGSQSCAIAAGAAAASCELRVPAGEAVTLVAAPATGTDFSGWSGACGGSYVNACTLTPNADAAVGARFTVTQVLVSVQPTAAATGGGQVRGSAGITCTLGASTAGTCAGSTSYGSTVTLVATPNATSSFVGWGDACRLATGPTCVVQAIDAVSATARFDLLRFPLAVTRGGAGGGTVASSPTGIACGGTCASTFVVGTSVTLTAASDGNSAFTGWTGACAGAGTTCVVSVDAARTVTATFAPAFALAIDITRDQGASGRVTLAPVGVDCTDACSRTFVAGTMVTLTATPTAGSKFDGWSGACSGLTPTCTVTVTAAQSVRARFVPTTYSVAATTAGTGTGAVASTPSGVACPGACAASFAPGTLVTLYAMPNATSAFAGWQGACSGVAPTCTVAVDAARSVTALFEAVPVATLMVLSLQVAGSGTGTVTLAPPSVQCSAACQQSYATNATVTLTAKAAPGSVFGGWAGECANTSTVPTCTVTMRRAYAITATFRK